ncbi:hypothetical protein GCM10027346_35750 [Hymenobacter seoulensis]
MKDQQNKPSDKKQNTPQGPDAMQPNAAPVDPETRSHSNSGGTQVQNSNQNGLDEAGNHTRNNAPGGGDSEKERTTQANKPRHNPNPSQQNQK